jgi:cellulose synthase/poly-beta-1,6-N-acetylglucosamine synthase-like glycosyltransferase
LVRRAPSIVFVLSLCAPAALAEISIPPEHEALAAFVAPSLPAAAQAKTPLWIVATQIVLYTIVTLICIYTLRHYWFTINRLFGRQRHPYIDIDTARWPSVTVMIPAHDEEAVIAHALEALLVVDYPHEKLQIMPVNDRSTDRTPEIIEDFARRHPNLIKAIHREDGQPGKAAVLRHATPFADGAILLIFDADYIPGKGLIKQLVAPFFDPEVGAVMGRVVPFNVERNLLTRLLDLERAGGYQVDQQARMNMHLVPQYGGTVGGVGRRALASVGGWRQDTLAEDTDITYRLLLGGWKTVYQNRSECYEEVPESWPARVRQVRRWATGHNEATARYSIPLLRNTRASFIEKLDGLLLLGVYIMPPLVLVGWLLAIVLFFTGEYKLHGVVALLAVTSYSALGNFAVFFEIAAATYLDGSRRRIRLLPFVLFGFVVSLMAITRAVLRQLIVPLFGRVRVWHKTQRFRKPA